MKQAVSARALKGYAGGWRRCGWALIAFSAPVIALANSFECLIEPHQVVEIRSSVEGLIDKIHVKRGDKVKLGQVLVQLESSAEQSAVDMAKYRSQMEGRISSSRNRLDYAIKKLDRSRELNKQNFLSTQEFDEADAEKRIAESELRDALDNRELAKHEHRHAPDMMGRRTLRSPFNGVVVERMLNPGDLAEAGTGRKPVLKLAQIEPLRVEVVLPLEAYGKLHVGDTADVIPEGLGGGYPASVTVVDSMFDSASGTFGVRLELPTPNGALPAGIRCRTEFPLLKDMGRKTGKSK